MSCLADNFLSNHRPIKHLSLNNNFGGRGGGGGGEGGVNCRVQVSRQAVGDVGRSMVGGVSCGWARKGESLGCKLLIGPRHLHRLYLDVIREVLRERVQQGNREYRAVPLLLLIGN